MNEFDTHYEPHVNFLNLEKVIADELQYFHHLEPKYRDWLEKIIRHAARQPNWRERMTALSIYFCPCITMREAALLRQVSRAMNENDGCYTSTNRFAGRYIIGPQDYNNYPWLQKALQTDSELVILGEVVFDPTTKVTQSVPRTKRNSELHHLCDALKYCIGNRPDFTDITHERAEEYAKWMQADLDRKAKNTEGQLEFMGHVTVWQDGHLRVLDAFWLLDKQAYLREGYVMQHCVGSYEVISDRAIISLRTVEGMSVATAEVNFVTNEKDHPCDWYITQIQAYKNGEVHPALVSVFGEWLFSLWGAPKEQKVVRFTRAIDVIDTSLLPHSGHYAINGQELRVVLGNSTIQGCSFEGEPKFTDAWLEELAQQLRDKGLIT